MIYGAFPPEFNSGRMYTGPGAGSLVAASSAWGALATELQSTAAAYSSVITTLTSGPWVGPSSLIMAAAVAPYLTWVETTAGQAAQAATHATAAASAYEEAFAATVPPPVIAANRSQLAALVATNIFGQNTAAIAATEAQYSEMWAQDALAMDSYLFSSQTVTSQLTQFAEPPQVTSAAGASTQAAAAAQAVGTSAGTAQSVLSSLPTPISALLQLGADISKTYTKFFDNIIDTLFGPTWTLTLSQLYSTGRDIESWTTQYNWIGLAINLPVSQFLKFSPPIPYGALPKDALGAGLGALGFGRGTLFSEINPLGAGMARGTLIGSLTVPPSWATNTPGVRMIASALSAAGPDAVPAAALGEGGLLSSMSGAGMLGAALGAGAPTVVARSGARGRLTPLKDLKDATSPEQLKRVVAQISEKPESVQHHTVEQEGLDALLEQLAKKPGIHAVHLSKGNAKVVPTEAQSG